MGNALFYVELVLGETPVWAYVVLVLLCVLGVRRMKSRATTLGGLAIVPTLFLLWSVVGAFLFSSASGAATAASLWLTCLTAGLFSFRLVGPPEGEWIDSQRFLRVGSTGPLLIYISIFLFRYGLEIWVGFVPERALIAHALAVTVSGFMAGRTLGDLWQAIRLLKKINPASFPPVTDIR